MPAPTVLSYNLISITSMIPSCAIYTLVNLGYDE